MQIHISDHFTFGKLLRFALPSIVMVIFTSLYGIVDGFFVSNFAGNAAFTAVNLFLPIFYIAGSIGLLLGSGGCALVAKLFGEGSHSGLAQRKMPQKPYGFESTMAKDDAARRLFTGLIIIVTAIGLLFTLSTIFFMPQIAALLGAKGETGRLCALYGAIMMGGLIPFMLQSFFQYFFAVADRPKLGLAITVGAGLTNALFDFVFMYAVKWGVTGAAIATIMGECVGGIVPLVWFLYKKGKKLHVAKPSFSLRPIGKVCVNGSSEFLSNISISLVSIIYNFQLLKYIGEAGVEAYGVIMYVSFIFVGCYLGYSVGTSPIVGYHYGAKNTDELKNVFKKSMIFYAVAAVVVTALSEALAKPLAFVFVSYDKELLELSVKALRLFSFSFLLSGFNIFASAFFTALNNGVISAVISTARTLMFQTVAVFVMPLIFGMDGIWGATIAAELLCIILSAVFIIAQRKRYEYL